MKLYEDFQRFNVFRRPGWRFDRVCAILDAGKKCSVRDDVAIRQAVSFRKAWTKEDATDASREKLFWNHPGLYYANQIAERFAEEPEPAMYIQARILARQSNETIAEALGTMPETIEWYEKLWFNVADRLENRDWITKHVLTPAFVGNHGFKPAVDMDEDEGGYVKHQDSTIAKPFLDASLKMFAYFGGTHLVDMLINGFQQGKPLQKPEDMAQWFDHHWALTIRRRSHQAALQFEINKYNVLELFAVHAQIIALEKSEDSENQQRTTVEKHIKGMLDDIPFVVGRDGATLLHGTALGAADETAIELRDDEVLIVAAGQKTKRDYLDKMPAPRKQKFVLEKTGKKAD